VKLLCNVEKRGAQGLEFGGPYLCLLELSNAFKTKTKRNLLVVKHHSGCSTKNGWGKRPSRDDQKKAAGWGYWRGGVKRKSQVQPAGPTVAFVAVAAEKTTARRKRAQDFVAGNHGELEGVEIVSGGQGVPMESAKCSVSGVRRSTEKTLGKMWEGSRGA